MSNVVNLFEPKSTPVKPDVSNETYFFTFGGTKFHFGGGAFTRELLSRLNSNRERITQEIKRYAENKITAVMNYGCEPELCELLAHVVESEQKTSLELLAKLKTPNDLDDLMSDGKTSLFMPLVLAAIIKSEFGLFDLLRMQRSNWCLIDGDAQVFLDELAKGFSGENFYETGDEPR